MFTMEYIAIYIIVNDKKAISFEIALPLSYPERIKQLEKP